MEKIISISFVILIILADPIFGQDLGKTFGGSEHDIGYSIQQTTDEGCFI
tara:strand:- start:434 stop:583 length:150 start_codon:yes stop_codon:yes gene_type:complete